MNNYVDFSRVLVAVTAATGERPGVFQGSEEDDELIRAEWNLNHSHTSLVLENTGDFIIYHYDFNSKVKPLENVKEKLTTREAVDFITSVIQTQLQKGVE